MILADTTIWIDHFRAGNTELRRQLEKRNVATHPFIVAELALGSLRERVKTLAFLDFLPHVGMAKTSEVREMIEKRSLFSNGIGLTDAHLIASCLISPATLLCTSDKRLRTVAASLRIAADLG
jgi:predicted nucleic acid-binding protein